MMNVYIYLMLFMLIGIFLLIIVVIVLNYEITEYSIFCDYGRPHVSKRGS